MGRPVRHSFSDGGSLLCVRFFLFVGVVEDLQESLYFWREALGFDIAYQRPEEKFAYLERPDGAQIMLCERSGSWEPAHMEKPYLC